MDKYYIAGQYTDYLLHRSNEEWEKHKYIKKEMKNGRWVYYYPDANTGEIVSEKEELGEAFKRNHAKTAEKISNFKKKVKKKIGLVDPKDRYKDEGYHLAKEEKAARTTINGKVTEYDDTKKRNYTYVKVDPKTYAKGQDHINTVHVKETDAQYIKRRLGVVKKKIDDFTGKTAKKEMQKAKDLVESQLVDSYKSTVEEPKEETKKRKGWLSGISDMLNSFKKEQTAKAAEAKLEKSMGDYREKYEQYLDTPIGQVETAVEKGKNWFRNLFRKKG